jgi:uncharacterized protein (TIGR03083 family)
MTYPELEALEAQMEAIDDLVDPIEGADWERPTRCAPMTLWDLVMHMSVNFTPPPLANGEAVSVTADAADWFRYDAADVAGVVVDRSRGVRESFAGNDPRERWHEFAAALSAFGRSADGDTPARHWDGRWMRLRDYIAARGVVELGVHSLDVADALGRPEQMHPRAEAVAVDILDRLLDGPRPEVDWDTTTYVLTATGRRPLTDDERGMLGPLAERFPLFA